MKGSARRSILRIVGGSRSAIDDAVADEAALEIRIRGTPVVVTMRTPLGLEADRELAVGLLCSEGWIRAADAIERVESCEASEGHAVNVILRWDAAFDPDAAARGASVASCGLCGKQRLDQVRATFPPLAGAARAPITADALGGLPERLRPGQAGFAATGGLHAAGLFDRAGRFGLVREDVGRHNAVDRVIGAAYSAGIDPRPLALAVSGRVSFEIIQKALAAGVGVVAAVSAPTTLAVDLARVSGMLLAGFVRDARMNVYSGAERVSDP